MPARTGRRHRSARRQTWPQSLQTVLRILLTSRYADVDGLGTGADLLLQRRLSRPTLGVKHPWALGRRASRGVGGDLAGHRPAHRTRAAHRRGDLGRRRCCCSWSAAAIPEETYHTFSYSPLPDDDGAIGGMLCVVTEETERVIGERRMATLRELAAGLAGRAHRAGSVRRRSQRSLGDQPARPAVHR